MLENATSTFGIRLKEKRKTPRYDSRVERKTLKISFQNSGKDSKTWFWCRRKCKARLEYVLDALEKCRSRLENAFGGRSNLFTPILKSLQRDCFFHRFLDFCPWIMSSRLAWWFAIGRTLRLVTYWLSKISSSFLTIPPFWTRHSLVEALVWQSVGLVRPTFFNFRGCELGVAPFEGGSDYWDFSLTWGSCDWKFPLYQWCFKSFGDAPAPRSFGIGGSWVRSWVLGWV